MATLDELELRLRALEQAQAAEPTSYYTSVFSGEEMDQRLAAAGALGAASTPQEALAALGAGVRPNLLDNAYFVGGGGPGQFPVNQRGQTSYSGNGAVAIDRWTMYDNANVMLGENGLTVSGTLAQLVQKSAFDALAGKTVTISAVLADGSYGSATGEIAASGSDTFISASIGNGQIIIASFNSVSSFQLARIQNLTDLLAIKVEVGSNQTLYYIDSKKKAVLLPQNLDYQQELAKCQAYYWKSPVFNLDYYSETRLLANIQFPVPMRTIPTISIESALGTPGVFSIWASMQDSEATLKSVVVISNEGLSTFEVDGAQNTIYACRIIASAEL